MAGKNRILVVVYGASLLASLGIGGCGTKTDPWPEGKSPRVLVSFPPLYCFTTNVAGDDAAVLSLLTTTGPHDYQPVARDAAKVARADLFLVNGLTLDESFAGALKNAAGKDDLRLIEVAEELPNLIRIAHEHHDNGPGHHHHGEFDPHAWLGITEAVHMVEHIRDALAAVNPERSATYNKNAAAYVERLQALRAEGMKQLAGKKNRKLVTFHESLAYFARSFDLAIVGSIEQRPGVEPDEGQMKKLIKLCKEQGVTVIAVEPQYPDNTAARTLAQEVPGAKIIILDPIETVSRADELIPDYYERKMRDNLNKLADALP